MLLNGMGGDEVFGGYRKYLACLTADSYQAIVPDTVRRIVQRAAELIPVATSTRGLKQVRWAKRFLSFASAPHSDRFMMSDLSLAPLNSRKCSAAGCRITIHTFSSRKHSGLNPMGSPISRRCA